MFSKENDLSKYPYGTFGNPLDSFKILGMFSGPFLILFSAIEQYGLDTY